MTPTGTPYYQDDGVALYCDDARSMDEVASGSVDLIITSPPYWTIKNYRHEQQIGLGQVAVHRGQQLLAGPAEGGTDRGRWRSRQRFGGADVVDAECDGRTERPAQGQPKPVVDRVPERRPVRVLGVERLDRVAQADGAPLVAGH